MIHVKVESEKSTGKQRNDQNDKNPVIACEYFIVR